MNLNIEFEFDSNAEAWKAAQAVKSMAPDFTVEEGTLIIYDDDFDFMREGYAQLIREAGVKLDD